MSIPTSEQLTKLRNPNQATKLYLSIYQPNVILSCRLNNATAAKGDRSIIYDGSSGDYTKVVNGMTLYVGSSVGAFDKGTIRVKSATNTTLTVAENSHIDWSDDDYLTVINFFEINPVYPRIIQSPTDETVTLWYKDYDIEYTNQNTVLGTFVCMGSHYAGFTGDPVYFSASGTYNLKDEALSYHWLFDGATSITGSSSHTPGYVTYGTPGHYTATLCVSGTSSSDTSYRHISIYNRPSDGVKVPILNWELMDLSGSRSQGGYTSTIRIRESIPENTLKDGSLVVIFSDDWYSDLTTRQSIGGNNINRSSVFFVGYVISGTISYNYRDSYVEFDVGSPTEIMKLTEGFSVSIRDGEPTQLTEDDPSGWVVMLDMDIRRAIFHYLKWHSTVLKCCDFRFIGDDRMIQYFDADRSSLYDAIQTILNGTLLGKLVSDRQGNLWAERDVWIEPTSFQDGFTIEKRDWMGDPQIDESSTKRVSYLEAGGVAYDGAAWQALLAAAPGSAPGYRGKIERVQGLALNDQDELNQITGDLFAQMNVKYSSVELSMSSSYRNFDIAPQEKYRISLSSSDTVRNISFDGIQFYPETMRYIFNPKGESLQSLIIFQQIASGSDADTLAIPVNPVQDSGGYTVPGFDFPLITFPSIGGLNKFCWSFVMGDAENTINTGIIGMIEVPNNCLITSVVLVANEVGSIVIDLLRCQYSVIEPGVHPVDSDSLVGLGDKPTLSSSYKSITDLTGWTSLYLTPYDWLYVDVKSCNLSLATLSVSGMMYQ